MSNRFWGWGREDDEFYRRIKGAGLQVRLLSRLCPVLAYLAVRVSGKGQDYTQSSLTPASFVLSFSAPRESQLATRHFVTYMTQPGGRGTRNALQLKNRCWLVSSVVRHRQEAIGRISPSSPLAQMMPSPVPGPGHSLGILHVHLSCLVAAVCI